MHLNLDVGLNDVVISQSMLVYHLWGQRIMLPSQEICVI